jgi:hypothetical protein
MSIDKAFARRPASSKPLSIDIELPEINWLSSLQKCEYHLCWVYSISRCALLNAPAGSFSKDIDEVEDRRAIVARLCAYARWRKKWR